MKDHVVSSGNVFKDMGLPNSEERLAKAKLAAIINRIIEEKGLSQKEAAKLLGINQPKISAIRNGRLNGFSIERLFHFLELLDQHIEITITHKSKAKTKAKARQGINIAYV
jgi:predicted XRE-type DNA-binding protein